MKLERFIEWLTLISDPKEHSEYMVRAGLKKDRLVYCGYMLSKWTFDIGSGETGNIELNGYAGVARWNFTYTNGRLYAVKVESDSETRSSMQFGNAQIRARPFIPTGVVGCMLSKWNGDFWIRNETTRRGFGKVLIRKNAEQRKPHLLMQCELQVIKKYIRVLWILSRTRKTEGHSG